MFRLLIQGRTTCDLQGIEDGESGASVANGPAKNDLRSIIEHIKVWFKRRGRDAAVLVQSRLLLLFMLVLSHQGFDPVGVIPLNVGALLAKVPKFVQKRDPIDEMLVDGRDLVLQPA